MRDLITPLIGVALAFCTFGVLAFGMTRHGPPGWDTERMPGYWLDRPELVRELPEILLEVSGVTAVDDRTLACVQDEDGIVFFYDLEENRIVRQVSFAGAGDYEGITRVGNTLYVLRSDGMLYEIDDLRSDQPQISSYFTGIPVSDNEGLCHDPEFNRLLIAGKGPVRTGEHKGSRAVYAFDLETKMLAPMPVLVFEKELIQRILGPKVKGTYRQIGIHPSAIAVHPVTDEIFILSSRDHLLYVFNRSNVAAGVYSLNKEEFAQPEGITFLDDGTLFISNEGRRGSATLLGFRYAQAK